MASVIGMFTGVDHSMFCQEIGQALMWLGCAFIGWIASSCLLEFLGCKKGFKASKARAGSDVFRKEVALYASKTDISAAAHHFGISESEVQQYYARFEKQQSLEKLPGGSRDAEEAQPPLCTARSTNAGHVLLEHYDVFQPCEGAWSGPLDDLEEQPEVEEEVHPAFKSQVTIPLSALQEVNAEEFFEGKGGISLWLVPDGHVYDHFDQCWVQDAAES